MELVSHLTSKVYIDIIFFSLKQFRVGLPVLLEDLLEHQVPSRLMVPLFLVLLLSPPLICQMSGQGRPSDPLFRLKRRHLVLVVHLLVVGIH
jgi:hypothetical protein